MILLASGDVAVRVTPTGGAIVDARWRDVPLLRPYPDAREDAIEVGRCGSFPLVPFGNRIEGNAFTFEGRTHRLAPNTSWDPHYLHGDGWTSRWDIVAAGADRAALAFERHGPVYRYRAEQTFAVGPDGFSVDLAVTNLGPAALPFGLGHHPFLPLTPETTLEAPATRYVTEKAGYLPDRSAPVPPRLDFSIPRKIPREWINNGFAGWSGRAVVTWPEARCALAIEAPCERYFLFHSTTDFEPAFRDDYFCFEPMTHDADAHGRPGGGLVRLEPGASTALRTSFTALPTEGRMA